MCCVGQEKNMQITDDFKTTYLQKVSEGSNPRYSLSAKQRDPLHGISVVQEDEDLLDMICASDGSFDVT
jgi:hypothetical protein